MKRTPLMRLTNQGLAAIDAAFLTGAPEALHEDPSFATPFTGLAPVPRAELRIDVPGNEQLSTEDDPRIAQLIHAQLPIRRGVATDPRFWAWLAACHSPDVLRRRWTIGDRPPSRFRFVGRLTENGLARLWWAAELTSDNTGVDEASLRALLSSQYRTDRLLGMSILRHPPVLRGFLDAIGDDLRWQAINLVCRRIGVLATTYAVPAMTRDEARDFVARVYKEVLETDSFSDATEQDSRENAS